MAPLLSFIPDTLEQLLIASHVSLWQNIKVPAYFTIVPLGSIFRPSMSPVYGPTSAPPRISFNGLWASVLLRPRWSCTRNGYRLERSYLDVDGDERVLTLKHLCRMPSECIIIPPQQQAYRRWAEHKDLSSE